MSGSTHARTPSAGRILLAILLGAAIVVNIVQFPRAERGLADNWRAVHAFETASLADIGLRLGDPDDVRERFGLALSLSEVAPGSTLIVPDWWHLRQMLDPGLLYGLGRVSRIEPRAYDPDTLHADVDLDPHVVRSGQGGVFGEPFAVATGDDPTELILLRREHLTIVLVDTSLLPSDEAGAPTT